jgi:hypothetical protein
MLAPLNLLRTDLIPKKADETPVCSEEEWILYGTY